MTAATTDGEAFRKVLLFVLINRLAERIFNPVFIFPSKNTGKILATRPPGCQSQFQTWERGRPRRRNTDVTSALPFWSTPARTPALPCLDETLFEAYNALVMEERDLFNEKDEVVPATVNCPKCRTSMEYPIRWRRRTKKATLPRGADERDRARYAKARDYRIRLDDKLRCARCGKTIEITTLQTVVFD